LDKAITCANSESVPVISCTDIYGNGLGDWIGLIADQYGTRSNYSEDPLFCDVIIPVMCAWLQECSPCLDWYGCGLIGSTGWDCPCGGGASGTQPVSWSWIKSSYR
jgi:hypothetical protein